MKHIDRFYYFLFKALSEANELPEFRYFLDPKNNVLIMKRSIKVNNEFIKKHIELPKLDFSKKQKFLRKFLSKENNGFVKSEISKIISSFNEKKNFNLTNDFKKINSSIAFQFELEKGTFLHESIEELYSNLNLDENMKLDFTDVQNKE